MSDIVRSDDLRRQNQRRILAALRRSGPLSRTELSGVTGLSASTVTLITAQLLERGALAESIGLAPQPGLANRHVRRGRPKVALMLNPDAASVGIVLLTLNQISASVIDYSGAVLIEKSRRLPTMTTGMEALRLELFEVFAQAIENCPSGTAVLRNLVIVVQGVTDADARKLLWSPVCALVDLPLADWFAEEFGVQAVVANDCNMIAAALRNDDPGRFGGSFAAVLLSHGIGMGLYLKGAIFTGLVSSAAEFGHMCFELNGAKCRCGRTGCIEAYAGDYAIWRAASGADAGLLPDRDFDLETMRALADAAKAGDGPERAAYGEAGRAIGAGLRSLFSLLDPFPVAFAGSGVLAFELMEPAIREAIGNGAAGVSHWRIPMYRYPDEFSLIRGGALVSALTHVDNHAFGSSDAIEKRFSHAV